MYSRIKQQHLTAVAKVALKNVRGTTFSFAKMQFKFNITSMFRHVR